MVNYVLGETASFRHKDGFIYGTIVGFKNRNRKALVKTPRGLYFSVTCHPTRSHSKPLYKRESGADLSPKRGHPSGTKVLQGLEHPGEIIPPRSDVPAMDRIQFLESEVARLTKIVERLTQQLSTTSVSSNARVIDSHSVEVTHLKRTQSEPDRPSTQSPAPSDAKLKRIEKRKAWRQRQRARAKDLRARYLTDFVPASSKDSEESEPSSVTSSSFQQELTASSDLIMSDSSAPVPSTGQLFSMAHTNSESLVKRVVLDQQYYRAVHLLHGKTQLYLVYQYLKILDSCDGYCHDCTSALVELLNLDVIPENDKDFKIMLKFLTDKFSFCDLPSKAIKPRFCHNVTPVKGLCKSYILGSHRDDNVERPKTV